MSFFGPVYSRGTYTKNFSVMQGVTSKKHTSINILRYPLRENDAQNLTIKIYEKDNQKELDSQNIKIKKIKFPSAELYRINIKFTPAENYILSISDSISTDIREFSKYDELKPNHNIAICSCMNDKYKKEQLKIWSSLSKKQPDYIFLIGDNVYGDLESDRFKVPDPRIVTDGAKPEMLLRRYMETRRDLGLFYVKKLIPVAMIWDDHDFGKNNGGADYKYKYQSKAIFRLFSLNENCDITKSGFGNGFCLKLADLKIYFLDNRFYRTKKSHFGKKQEQWLFDSIDGDSIIISGDQFFGKYHPFESFEGEHPENFRYFIRKLSQLQSPPLLVSGDRHLSEIQTVRVNKNNRFMEITSSPMHSSLTTITTLKKYPNSNRNWVLANKNNFCILSFRKKLRGSRLEFYDENGSIIHSQRYPI